ncbi:EF-hand domain-containing protein [Verrucomicrobiaceae bacterium 227]
MLKSLSILSSLVLIFPADAQGPPSGGPPGGPRGKGEPKQRPSSVELIKRYDANDDGKLSRAEFARGERVKDLPQEVLQKLFGRFDKDQDGFITKKELVEIPAPPGGRQGFGRADTNKDGRITFEEFSKSTPRFADFSVERMKAMFERFDRNKDGFLDSKDHPDRHREGGRRPMPRIAIKGLDSDNNGSLSWAEFQNAPAVLSIEEKDRRRLFGRFDDDRNGELSPKELRMPFERDEKGGGGRPEKGRKGPKK